MLVTGVTVASPACGVSGSSVTSSVIPVPVTRPWLVSVVMPAGTGSSTVTSKATVTEAPVLIEPTDTVTGAVPVTLPWEVVTEPATRWVFAGRGSVRTTPAAGPVPELAIRIS